MDKSSNSILVEVCVDNLASAMAAQTGGASRIELCAALSEGGLTPSAGLITKARALLSIGIFVMIRPRSGNFVYSEDDFNAMLEDISTAKLLGADGIVSGVLKPDNSLDVTRTIQLVQAAKPLPFTFHRAFDLTPDPFAALEQIISCGCVRILTSGQQKNAIEGKVLIRQLVLKAADRITIMPGCGVNENNVELLITETHVSEVHLSGRQVLKPLQNDLKTNLGDTSFHRINETDPEIINRVKQIVDSVNSGKFPK